MIPAKIITKEEAEKLGLTREKRSGIAAAGCVMSGKKGEKGEVVERTIIRENGEFEMTFMAEERKKELRDRNELADYLNQFHIIEGKEKATFLKENNLKPTED